MLWVQLGRINCLCAVGSVRASRLLLSHSKWGSDQGVFAAGKGWDMILTAIVNKNILKNFLCFKPYLQPSEPNKSRHLADFFLQDFPKFLRPTHLWLAKQSRRPSSLLSSRRTSAGVTCASFFDPKHFVWILAWYGEKLKLGLSRLVQTRPNLWLYTFYAAAVGQ